VLNCPIKLTRCHGGPRPSPSPPPLFRVSQRRVHACSISGRGLLGPRASARCWSRKARCHLPSHPSRTGVIRRVGLTPPARLHQMTGPAAVRVVRAPNPTALGNGNDEICGRARNFRDAVNWSGFGLCQAAATCCGLSFLVATLS
jgi:hypothetical protein